MAVFSSPRDNNVLMDGYFCTNIFWHFVDHCLEEFVLGLISWLLLTQVDSCCLFFSFLKFKLCLRFVKWSALFRNIQNVVAKLESGLGSRHALLVNCHFDSVPQSPGNNIVVVDGKFYIDLDFNLNKRWKKIGVTYLSRQKKNYSVDRHWDLVLKVNTTTSCCWSSTIP